MEILIKRYPNRRLYDTGRSAYITLDELALDLSAGKRVRVEDSKTGEDLTQRVLLQQSHSYQRREFPSTAPEASRRWWRYLLTRWRPREYR